MRKKTNIEFISHAKLVHGELYDYSQVNYESSFKKVKIICTIHNIPFEIKPNHHLDGQKCPECSSLKKDSKLFIEQCSIVHENRYDYSLVDYKTNKSKIKIICQNHGVFIQNAKDHLNGNKCNKCRSSTIDKFVNKANGLFNFKYDYSLVSYKNSRSKVKITCNKHGIFEQIANNHLLGHGCPSCNYIKMDNNSFITICIKTHGDRFNYDDVKFTNTRTKIKINCKIHGQFNQMPNAHLSGQGCPGCNLSKGEYRVEKYLQSNSIEYIRQYKFDECKNKKKLPFDFYLPDINLAIEYDGEQHFNPVFGDEAFIRTQFNDNIKNKFCDDNNIKLIRIKYDQNIEKKLNDYVKSGK